MKFEMEDVRVDVKNLVDGENGEFWEWQQYKLTHLPTGEFVFAWGVPMVKRKEKEFMIERLQIKVEHAT